MTLGEKSPCIGEAYPDNPSFFQDQIILEAQAELKRLRQRAIDDEVCCRFGGTVGLR